MIDSMANACEAVATRFPGSHQYKRPDKPIPHTTHKRTYQLITNTCASRPLATTHTHAIMSQHIANGGGGKQGLVLDTTDAHATAEGNSDAAMESMKYFYIGDKLAE